MPGIQHVVFCIDNSAWSRNGDFRPTRLDSQLDTIYDIYPNLLDSNAESTLGIIAMGGNRVAVRTSLTHERYKIGVAMNNLEKKGDCDLYRGLAMAQLVLKHRENAHGETRIIAFVGSPLKDDPRLMKLALMLSKDQIAVNIISFGEIDQNHSMLEEFISKVSIDGNSHLYEISPYQSFADVILPNLELNAFGGEEELDPDLLRALEESRRTYQMESGQMAVEGGAEGGAGLVQTDANDLADAFAGMDLEEDFDAALSAALLESMREYQNNDSNNKNGDEKDDNEEVD